MYNARYVVQRKLGWGHFSTVWRVFDRTTGRTCAMKVQKSATHYMEAAMDEVELLDKVTEMERLLVRCRQWVLARECGQEEEEDATEMDEVEAAFRHMDEAARLGLVEACSWYTGRLPVVRLLDHFAHVGPNGKRKCAPSARPVTRQRQPRRC